jgi:hypothetical protein
MLTLASMAGWVVIGVLVAQRCVFLAPARLGWIFYLANAFGETFVKKLRLPRTAVEYAMAAAALLLLGLGGVPPVMLLTTALVLAGSELLLRSTELRILRQNYIHADPIGLDPRQRHGPAASSRRYPSPSTHPELTLNLRAAFVSRIPHYDLGSLLENRGFEVELLIGNHTIVPTQTGVEVRLTVSEGLSADAPLQHTTNVLKPAEVARVQWRLRAPAGTRAGTLSIHVAWGHLTRTLTIRHAGAVRLDEHTLQTAAIHRYPGGCRAAFAWRGDMDLYDTSTLQSIEGLETTLGLAARYRVPQTMYLSTRLALDPAAARAWAAHYGIDRGAGEIPRFIEWMRERVDLRHTSRYPFETAKPYLIELGNHGHLHFGTDTAGAAENGWRARAKMGAGAYAWLGQDRSSFGEQRDNALEARRWCEELFGFTPKSWAMPNRTNDAHTAAAMEAAGCDVVSDSNARTRHNVLLQPPPHHPSGTTAVELTKRYPGDPENLLHAGMIVFWLHRAHRLAIPAVFMCHQHMRQFNGYACARFTEFVLHYALTNFNGDLFVSTVYEIGKFWREVLSPQTRRVEVKVKDRAIRIINRGDLDLIDAPLDVTLGGGLKLAFLINCAAGSTSHISLDDASG